MPIPDHLVEQIREAADLVEIVSEHTRLKRSGKTFRGPCPLHGGEGPNFSVDPSKGFYKCFVCGEGGTVYTFLMKHLGMTYPDAIRHVAARVGIEVPDERAEQREEDPNRHYYEVNAFARDWFRKQLWDTDGGRAAREYLEKRGVSREHAERFGLGWAPEEWTAFGDVARQHGITSELLLELGLAKESKSGRDPYDVFRGRVVFPIEDLSGRVVAFGGRILGSAEEHVPKYLNSPETPVYSKGRTLYGLNWSKNAIRREETALVVEGYMDYVSLASHGVANAVAPLGTAMTEEQAALIARYCGRAILLYDSDKAGLKATFRTGDELLRGGMEVLVATLPQGEDPDSLVRGQGAAALKRYLDDAVDVLERKIQILERKDYFGSIRGTRQAIDALLPTVRAASNELVRGVYIQRISEKTGVRRETFEQELRENVVRRAPSPIVANTQSSATQQRIAAEVKLTQTAVPLGPERDLTLVMLWYPPWIEAIARELQPSQFRDPVYRWVFETMLQLEAANSDHGVESFPLETRAAVELLKGTPEGAAMGHVIERIVRDSIREIKARPFVEKLTEVDRLIGRASEDEMDGWLSESFRINREMRDRGLATRSKFWRMERISPNIQGTRLN